MREAVREMKRLMREAQAHASARSAHMIFGIGTDIVAVARIGELCERHGERGLEQIAGAGGARRLSQQPDDPARFLAKRFAAKEALGKALGTGVARAGYADRDCRRARRARQTGFRLCARTRAAISANAA